MLDSKITVADIRYIATHMRRADRDEVKAASGLSTGKVLVDGIKLSTESMVYRDPYGTPVFIVGVAEPGIIWLLGTDDIVKHKRGLHKLAKQVLTEWHKQWPTMANMVDARNTVHIRWLTAMGFKLWPPVIHGVAKLPFIPFSRTQSIV